MNNYSFPRVRLFKEFGFCSFSVKGTLHISEKEDKLTLKYF